MAHRPRRPWWQKLLRQAAPLVIASLVCGIATGIGTAIVHHVVVSVRIR